MGRIMKVTDATVVSTQWAGSRARDSVCRVEMGNDDDLLN